MQQTNEKMTLVDWLSRVIHKSRFVLWGIVIAAAVLTVGWFAWEEINKRVADSATKASEAVQEAFEAWQGQSDTEKKKTAETDLTKQLTELIRKYPRQYGGQRALFMRAEISFENKAWEEAGKDYLELVKSFPRSYLAPLCLFNAAVCAEQKGDAEGALKAYERVIAEHADCSFAAHSLFCVARLQEQKNAVDEAQKTYNRLESEYPDSGWTNYAKNRIIELKVAGKIK